MLDARLSPELKALSERLNDAWEEEQVAKLPFPVAYVLARARAEGHPWDLIVKDLVSAIVRYLAVVGISDYLHSSTTPDFDLNERLQKLSMPMIEGNWLAIATACAARGGETNLPEYGEALRAIERGRLTVSLDDARHGLRAQRLGLLSALLSIRNKLFAHGTTLTQAEKDHAGPIILSLVRAVLYTLAPIWEYDFLVTLNRGGAQRTLRLRGVEEFEVVGYSPVSQSRCSLRLPGGVMLPLEPLAFPESVRSAAESSLLDEQAEIYIINQIKRQKTRQIPEYTGVAGGYAEREDLEPQLSDLFRSKRIWERRVDVELDAVLDYARKKTRMRLDELESEGLIDRVRHVRRHAIERVLDDFIQVSERKALFVTGASGSGKTASLFDWVSRQVDCGIPVLLLRAKEFKTEVIKGKRLAERLAAELGTVRTITEVLERATQGRTGRFLIVIDGLNEFTGAGRDGSLLFRAINSFLTDHRQNTALRLIVTSRSDGLEEFLPNKRLPADVEEDLWVEIDGRSYFEMPPMTPEEARSLLRAYGAEDAQVESLVSAAGTTTPDLLRKAGLGALSAEDLGQLDERGVTSRYLEQRLGKDKALRRVVMDLVKAMMKSRDLTVEEATLAKTSPKLHARLRAQGDKMLTTLRELGIAEVIPRVDENGQRSWALALAHDSLFEALLPRVQRRLLVTSLMFAIARVAILLSLLIGAVEALTGSALVPALRKKVDDIVEFDRSSLPASDRIAFDEEWGKVHEGANVCVRAYSSVVKRTLVSLYAHFCAVFGAFSILLSLCSRWLVRRQCGSVRVRLFGLDDQLRLILIIHYVYVPLIAIAGVIMTIFLESGQADRYTALAPMYVVIVIALSGLLGAAVVKWRRARKRTPAIWQYYFSREGLAFSRRHSVFLSTMVVIAFLGLRGLLDVPLYWFLHREPLQEARVLIAELNRQTDWDVLEKHGVGPLARFILSGRMLDETEERAASLFTRTLLSWDDRIRPRVEAELFILFGIVLSLIWISYFVEVVLSRRPPSWVKLDTPTGMPGSQQRAT